MRLRCEGCGHEQEIRKGTKRARCSVCHSRRLIEYVDNPHADNIASSQIEDISRREKETIGLKREEKKEKEREEKKRRMDNELVHRGGKKDFVKAGEELLLGIGSLVGEKKPGGHFSKSFINLANYLEKKRFLKEHGGDVRILGDNARVLMKGRKGIVGLGIFDIGEEGIIGMIMKKGESEGEEKKVKEGKQERKSGVFY